MNKPPVMVSTKDSMYITDVLNITHCFIKKFDHYDNEIQDTKIKKLVNNATNELIKQYNSLMEELKHEE